MDSTDSSIDDPMESADSSKKCISELKMNSTEFTFDEYNTGLYNISIGFLELVTKKVDNENMHERLGSMIMGQTNETARDLLSSIIKFQWAAIVLITIGLLIGAAALVYGLYLVFTRGQANSRVKEKAPKWLLIIAEILLATVSFLGCFGIYMLVVGMANLFKTLDATTTAINATSQYFQHVKAEAPKQLNCLTDVVLSEAFNDLKRREKEFLVMADTLFVRFDYRNETIVLSNLMAKSNEISRQSPQEKTINDTINTLAQAEKVFYDIRKDIEKQKYDLLSELTKKIPSPIHDVGVAYDQNGNSAKNIFLKTGVLIDQLKNVTTTAIGYIKQLQDMESITKPIGAAIALVLVVYQIFFFLAIGLAIFSHMKNNKTPATERGKLSNRLGFVVYASAAIVLLSLWFIMLASSAFFSASLGVQFGCDSLFGDTNLTLFTLKPFQFELPDMNGTMQPIFLKNLIKGCKDHPDEPVLKAIGMIDLIDGEELLPYQELDNLYTKLFDITEQLPVNFTYDFAKYEKTVADMKNNIQNFASLLSGPQFAKRKGLYDEMLNVSRRLTILTYFLKPSWLKSAILEQLDFDAGTVTLNSRIAMMTTIEEFQIGLNDTVRCAPLYEQFTQLGDSICVPFARSLSLMWAGSGLAGLAAVFGVVGMHFVFGSLLNQLKKQNANVLTPADIERDRTLENEDGQRLENENKEKTEETKTGTDGRNTPKDNTQ